MSPQRRSFSPRRPSGLAGRPRVRRPLTSLLAGCLALLLSTCAVDSDVRTLRLAHGLDVTHPVHLGMVYMAERAAELSDGKLAIAIYPSQQLGTERQNLELLQIGSLAMTKVSASILENFAPQSKVLSLPYIFQSREHAYKFQDSQVGRDLLTQSEQYRLRGLVYFDAGQRSFYTKERAVRTPDDLQGQKIRVQQSATAIEMVKAFGGSPTPISYGELYTALQQGVVDGAENNPPSFYTSRHYEVCKYYSLNEHSAVPDVLVIGTDAWERLSPTEREWLQQAADDAVVHQRQLWQEAEQEALTAVTAAGVEIIRPDKSLFIDKAAGILDGYRDETEVYALIQQILAMNQSE